MKMSRKQRGFTLIELMIVVAIIGILAAIAIPQFASYRVKAYNSAAASDLKTALTMFETFFNDYGNYPDATSPATGSVTLTDGTNSVTLKTSSNVYFASDVGTNNQTYAAATKHTSGDKIYTATSDAPTVTSSSGSKGAVLASSDLPTVP